MGDYKELFVSQYLGYYTYAAVIFDVDVKCFYNALFEGVQFGGNCGNAIKQKGKAISIDSVRKLARASEDRRAEKYVNITENNWNEVISQ